MQHVNGIRKAAVAIAALSAALSVTACQAGGSKAGAESPSTAPSSAPSASTTPGTTAPAPAGAPTTKAPTAKASPISGSGSTGTAVKTCAATALKVTAHQAADRPDGTGTGAAVVEFTNVSAQPCTLQGHPTVAGAANGSPQHNAPLKVTPTGSAAPVRLAPGSKASLKLTFVQVQGEADGYCKSGAQPASYPTMVIGLPGSGAHQVALDDGVFAECDNTVTATAVSAATS
ncbi:hypothetical protein GCM10022403_009050 [Streptomyces coacervatus]|uniref:DUF4232 domain-containing protein n=1 Tax=Streptomyces coacervatus TaxID=647381 RepID=A0ABP7GXH2_9ACTN|nr:DUF4232 domain-containing protein [Streptomyces coacervatus]MDF2268327.1 DUF4232 domain-containing protein [Streptomyces coacervatus]